MALTLALGVERGENVMVGETLAEAVGRGEPEPLRESRGLPDAECEAVSEREGAAEALPAAACPPPPPGPPREETLGLPLGRAEALALVVTVGEGEGSGEAEKVLEESAVGEGRGQGEALLLWLEEGEALALGVELLLARLPVGLGVQEGVEKREGEGRALGLPLAVDKCRRREGVAPVLFEREALGEIEALEQGLPVLLGAEEFEGRGDCEVLALRLGLLLSLAEPLGEREARPDQETVIVMA